MGHLKKSAVNYTIRELVDSLCRMTWTHEKCNPFIMLSKTHIVGQKPRGRQLAKYKVCESAIFVLSSDHFVQQR